PIRPVRSARALVGGALRAARHEDSAIDGYGGHFGAAKITLGLLARRIDLGFATRSTGHQCCDDGPHGEPHAVRESNGHAPAEASVSGDAPSRGSARSPE